MIGSDADTGEQIWETLTGSSREDVCHALECALASLESGKYFKTLEMTLGEWADTWLEQHLEDQKYSTIKHFRAQCNTHIKPGLGHIKLIFLTAPMIQRFYDDLKKDKGLSDKSVHNVHIVLAKCLSVAKREGIIQNDPTANIVPPKFKKEEIIPLTGDQIKAFMEESKGDEFEIPLKVILFTGMREAEALGLTWDSIDFEHDTITIDKQLQRRPIVDGGYTFETPKDNDSRTILAAPHVMEMLREQRSWQEEMRKNAGEEWKDWCKTIGHPSSLVFTKPNGDPIRAKRLFLHYKDIAVRIGAPDSNVHTLRHTYATLSLQNGDNVKTLQKTLGHSTAMTTLDYYGHVSKEMKEKSADHMQDYIDELVSKEGKERCDQAETKEDG